MRHEWSKLRAQPAASCMSDTPILKAHEPRMPFIRCDSGLQAVPTDSAQRRPHQLVHGTAPLHRTESSALCIDFDGRSPRVLIAAGEAAEAGDHQAIDLAPLGVSPVGFDIIHLALATLDDSIVKDCLDGLKDRNEADAVHFGYASRSHSSVRAGPIGWSAARNLYRRGISIFVVTRAT